MNFIGNCSNEIVEEFGCGGSSGLLEQFREDELRSAVNSDQQIEPTIGTTNLGNIDVEISNRISLELTLGTGAVVNIREP